MYILNDTQVISLYMHQIAVMYVPPPMRYRIAIQSSNAEDFNRNYFRNILPIHEKC